MGQGGYGKVYLSHSIHQEDFHIAIKAVDKQKLNTNLNLVIDEIAILRKLDHPNIVKYIECYNDQKYIYLVMEYIPGKQLFEHITADTKRISEAQICSYMRQIVSAIAYCHSQNILHQDIKPENIMITHDGNVKLIDFGLSHDVGDKEMLTAGAGGTPYYMAPEVFQGTGHDIKADIWSLGVLMYISLSGVMPFNGKTKEDLKKQVTFGRFDFEPRPFNKVS